MRTTPPALSALLLAATLAALPAAAQAPVTVDASHLRSLQARLDGFAGGLRAEERALWNRLLLRAASAPAGGSEVQVLPVLEIGPGGGCDAGMTDGTSRVAIIVQGGRAAAPASGIVVQGGRTAQGAGIVVQGGRTAQGTGAGARVGGRPGAAGVTRPTDVVSIGPKQEDPTRPAPDMLARRLTDFAGRLPAEERGALEWLLTRAAAVPEGRPSTGGLASGAGAVARPLGEPGPGGMPEGIAVSLRQALGVDALSIGPKQEDPTRGPPTPSATRWTLRH